MRNSSIEIQPIAGALGAEIGGVNLAEDLSDQVIADIRQALLDHCVIFFRDQEFDVDRHKAFARRFGEIFIHPNFRGTQADPEVVNVVRNPGDARIVGEKWHHDTTMVEEPPMGAVFYAIEVPPYGGDTLFANQYLAYETLSPALRALVDGLRVKHTDIRIAGPQAAVSKSRATAVREDADWRETINFHPAAITHPETGRRALFVNHSHCVAFEGMTEEESKPLLDYLMDHGQRPEFTCRFRYEPGSVVFWDNRCVKHMAVNDAGPFRRVARRIQIQGGVPA
jgi:taurine dioxygenase